MAFLKDDVLPTSTQILDDDDLEGQRERNEKLAAYLPNLVVALGTYREHIDDVYRQYKDANPKPEKGVTEWREAFDLKVSHSKRLADMLEGLIESVKTRVSVTQSNLKSHAREG